MMSLTFGLFTQVSDSGPQGPLVCVFRRVMVARCRHLVSARKYRVRRCFSCFFVLINILA